MSIKLIKTLQELDDIQTYWERWQDHPNNDFAQFKLVCQLRPEIESPFVIVIERSNQPHALLVGRLEQTKFAPSIGYLKPVNVSAKVISIIHQGLLGQWDEETATESVHYLWSLLGSGLADAIEFHHLSEDSPLLKALLVYGSRWFCEKKLRCSLHWQTKLPTEGGFLEHKMSSKRRKEFRRIQRKLETVFSDKITWHWMSRFDDVPGLCARLEELAARTYQRGLEAGFMDNEEHRQRLALLAMQGRLRVQLLEDDGRVVAFYLGSVWQEVFYLSETSYDPDYRKYEPGTLTFFRMADEAAHEGVLKLNYGLGDAPYKQRFGDHSWQEKTIWLFAPNAKGMLLRSMLRLSIIVDCTARRILQQMGAVEKLKSFWRKRLAKGEMETNESEKDT